MNLRKGKKLTAFVMAGTMLCSGANVYAASAGEQSLAYESEVQSEERAVLEVSFVNEYAKVGEPLIVQATGENCSYEWYVDDRLAAENTDRYTPTENDLEKWITVKVADGDQTVEKSMYCSKLPVVYIDTENNVPITSKEDYVNATLKMQGNDLFNSENTTLYTGAIEIRGRGNSTWGMPKKPYKIKLDSKTDIFGMGKNKHWVLLANYSDTSLMRNTLAYNLSGQMGMPQMETTWVDVILNGKYVGNYQFCEQIKIDKKRVNVFDWESFAGDAAEAIAEAEGITDVKGLEDTMAEDLNWVTSRKVTFEGKTYNVNNYIEVPDYTGGYLMELDQYYDEISKFKTQSGQPIMFKSPEFVNTNKTMIGYVQEYIQAFENAVESDDYTAFYKGEKKHYSELFDFDALVDYWVINELFYNEEFNKKSTYLYKDIDGLVYMGPMWDMDYSSGGEGYTYKTNGWATKDFNISAQAQMWYKFLIKDPYFVVKVQERYWDIRDTYVEDMVKEGGIIDTNYDYLMESGKANTKLWMYKGHDLAKGVQVLKDWMNKHFAWMDQQMDTEDSLMASLGAYKTSAMNLTMSDAKGNVLPADDVSAYAKADYLAEDGCNQKLHIETKDTNAVKAAVYVNGKCIGEAELNGGKADAVITAGALTAEAGKKDVVEVKLLNGSNAIIGSNYVSLLEQEASTEEIENPFTDIAEDRYDYDAVLWAYKNGIVNGIEETRFVPDGIATRAQAVTFLWRMNGAPAPEISDEDFVDVTSDSYYYDAVIWAVKEGIVKGIDETHFKPEAFITRGDFAALLYRAAGSPGHTAENLFQDVTKGMYYYNAVMWAYENGITLGTGENTFSPNKVCTRGQLVTFLYRNR